MEEEEVKKLAQGTGVTLAGGIANSGLSYLSGVAISRVVGPELIGAYYLCVVWAQLAGAMSRLGFGDALLRFVPSARLDGDETRRLRLLKSSLAIGVATSLAVGTVLAACIAWFGTALGLDLELRRLLPWFFLLIPAHTLLILLLMSVQAHQDMIPVVWVRDVLQPGLLLAATLGFFVFLTPGAALATGFAVSLIAGIAVIGLRLGRLAPGLTRTQGWSAPGPLFAFSLPVMLGDVSHYLARWIDTITIGALLELREVGIYNAAARTSLLIGLIFMAANAIYSTMVAGYFHAGSFERARSALQLSVRWCITLALPIVVLFWAGGEHLLSLWGEEFTSGADALVLLAIAQLLMVPTGILAYTLLMSGRQLLELFDTLLTLAMVVAGNVVLVPRFGLVGAAMALLVANAVSLAARWLQVRWIFGFHPFGRCTLKPIAAAAVTFPFVGWTSDAVDQCVLSLFGAGWPAELATVAALGSVVLLVFGGVLWALGFEDEDRTLPDILRTRASG